MYVKNIMRKDPVTISPEASYLDARGLGDEEVPQLVDGDDAAQEDDNRSHLGEGVCHAAPRDGPGDARFVIAGAAIVA